MRPPAACFKPRNTKRGGRALHLSGCAPHLLFSRLGRSGLNPSGLARRGPIIYSTGVLNLSGLVRPGQIFTLLRTAWRRHAARAKHRPTSFSTLHT